MDLSFAGTLSPVCCILAGFLRFTGSRQRQRAQQYTLDSIDDHYLMGVFHYEAEEAGTTADYLLKHVALKLAYNTLIYPYINHFFSLLDQLTEAAPGNALVSLFTTYTVVLTAVLFCFERTYDLLAHTICSLEVQLIDGKIDLGSPGCRRYL